MFRERGREGEKEGEKYQCEGETSIDCLSYMLRLWSVPATQACTLIKNQIGGLFLCGTTYNQPSYTGQGCVCFLGCTKIMAKLSWPGSLGNSGLCGPAFSQIFS